MSSKIVIPGNKIYTDFNNAMGAFLEGEMCINGTLVMPSRKVKCSNCTGVRDPIGNKPSNASWSGRPKPFSDLGNCDMCNGEGFVQEEIKEDIKIRPYWTKEEWIIPQVRTAENRTHLSGFAALNDLDVQIKTWMYNIAKILNAAYLELSNVPGLSPYRIYRFSLEGEPFPHGLDSKTFCLSFWKRATGI